MMYVEPDEQAIMALERVSTGADIHDTRNLIQTYRNAPYVGEHELAP